MPVCYTVERQVHLCSQYSPICTRLAYAHGRNSIQYPVFPVQFRSPVVYPVQNSRIRCVVACQSHIEKWWLYVGSCCSAQWVYKCLFVPTDFQGCNKIRYLGSALPSYEKKNILDQCIIHSINFVQIFTRMEECGPYVDREYVTNYIRYLWRSPFWPGIRQAVSPSYHLNTPIPLITAEVETSCPSLPNIAFRTIPLTSACGWIPGKAKRITWLNTFSTYWWDRKDQ